MINGMIRVASVAPVVHLADPEKNADEISANVRRLAREGVSVVLFPELSLTGYSCADLFHSSLLIEDAAIALEKVAEVTAGNGVVAVVGLPCRFNNGLYNCAAVLYDGAPVAIIPKSYIPNCNEFYELRWFAMPQPGLSSAVNVGRFENVPFAAPCVIDAGCFKIGVEICEDLWAPIPPSSRLALGGADLILNLSASNDLIGKRDYLTGLIARQSAACLCAYVYASAGWGESSTDLVFDGKAIIAENGRLLAQSPRWQIEATEAVADIDLEAIARDRLHNPTFAMSSRNESVNPLVVRLHDFSPLQPDDVMREVDSHPFVPASTERLSERCEEILNIQALGLARRLDATRTRNLVVGISGGLDSTLALLVACKAFDVLGLSRNGIIGITMPGFGTTGRTYNNALTLMQTLGVEIREIPIADAVKLHFRDIGHDPEVIDVTYENSQARERTQILMDVANQVGGMVLGTGDLSELALGWATYNGDHMSMYGVNAGVPKTLVRHLVSYYAENVASEEARAVLRDIVDTPISPELTPADSEGNIAQKTEDLVGPYELHDFFLYYMLRHGFSPKRILALADVAFKEKYPHDVIVHWLKTFIRRFFNQQFKRSCLPDGPKVGSVCLSPRGDWRMPSDASSAAWLKELDGL